MGLRAFSSLAKPSLVHDSLDCFRPVFLPILLHSGSDFHHVPYTCGLVLASASQMPQVNTVKNAHRQDPSKKVMTHSYWDTLTRV